MKNYVCALLSSEMPHFPQEKVGHGNSCRGKRTLLYFPERIPNHKQSRER